MKILALVIALVAPPAVADTSDGRVSVDDAGHLVVIGPVSGSSGGGVTCSLDGPTGRVTWNARSDGTCYTDDMRPLRNGEKPLR